MEKKWIIREKPIEEEAGKLSRDLNINNILASILLQRGISDFSNAKEFFRPSLEQLHDPFLMKDMDRAVNRLCDALSKDESILIYGDYDVDGTTSVALVYSFLKEFTDNIKFYIPDRYKEGYGISRTGIKWAIDHNVNLIIALDCGIKANKNVGYAKENGIEVIICDHHLPGVELPDAYAILDPKQEDCNYPYKELPGCGIGFKLLSAFCIQNTVNPERLLQYLDLVVISIASDIVPITGENRILAYYGLKKINRAPMPGVFSLISIAGVKGTITISDIVFYLGPRINASGRLAHAHASVEVLISDHGKDLEIHTKELNNKNVERKGYDHTITKEALEMIQADESLSQAKSTVVFKENWHKGVIGIVASRLTEHYYRPTIVLTEANGKATGSARSVKDYNIYNAISQCETLLDQFGGHKYAAGLTLSLEKVEDFIKKFENVVAATISDDQLTPKLYVDYEVPLEFVNFKSNSILSQMAPFGPGNEKPVFVSREVQAKAVRQLKGEHLKLSLMEKGSKKSYEAIGFGLGHLKDKIQADKPFDVAYQIDENEYRGNKSLQLILKDIKFSD